MVLEIFPLKNREFSFWKLRFFFLWSQSEEDEDGLEMMKIYSWSKNDDDLKKKKKNLDFEWE